MRFSLPFLHSKYQKQLLVGALIVSAGLGGYGIGFSQGAAELTKAPSFLINTKSTGDLSLIVNDPGATVDFGDFWKTWAILEKNFAPSTTTAAATSTAEDRVAGAIAGLVSSYDDPYTVFIPKEQAVTFKEQVNGEFEGIGAALAVDGEQIVVTGILPNSPASKTAIKPGFVIVAVDGQPTLGRDLPSIISTIRGPKGTTVALTVAPSRTSTKEQVIEVTRGTVVIPTTATRVVSAAKSVIASVAAKASAAAAGAPGSTSTKEEQVQKANDTAFFVLQLATFAKTSTDAFITDLGKFAASDAKYLIIDLRNNPGGYIDVAADLASYFLPKDTLVVTEVTGADRRATEFRSKGYDTLGPISTSTRRIVVLLNKSSASASEILAGALQDHGYAKVVGETSFGKGSVQTLVDIGTLGSLKLTIARWYTPSGRDISHVGITPDIAVDVKDPKYASSTDPYIDAATEALLDDTLWK